MLFTKPGFIAKADKINRFLKSAKVRILKEKLTNIVEKLNKLSKDYSASDWGILEDCQDYLDNFKPVELAFLQYHWQEEKDLSSEIAYLCARHSEEYMFEVAGLDASLGNGCHPLADQLGLKEDRIKEYQEIWREFGTEPTLANYDFTGYEGEKGLEDVTVEDLEQEIKKRLPNN